MHTLDGLNDTSLAADNQNIYVSYRHPFLLWQLQLTYNHNRYTQTLKGWNHNPIYKGVTQRKQAKLSRTLFRDSHTKLIGYGVIAHKDSQYHIDDLKILVQRCKISNYSLGFNLEKTFYHQGRLNLDANFNQGVAAFHALPSPECYYRDVDSRPLVWQVSGNYRLPFNTTHHQFGLNTHFHAQYSNDKLPFANQSSSATNDFHSSRTVKLTTLALSLWTAYFPVFVNQAMARSQIHPLAQGNPDYRPTLLHFSNGVPVVNIRTINEAGVSRNQFGQFDIDDQSVILNNARFGTNTQLAGQIDGNFWLLSGEAATIVMK